MTAKFTTTLDAAAAYERWHSDTVADRPDPSEYAEDRPCSVGQVGDREWWCSTHRCDAEVCAEVEP